MSEELRDRDYLMEQRELFLKFALRVGFPAELGMTEAEYARTVPEPPAQPVEWETRHPILLPVEGRIGYYRLGELVYGRPLFKGMFADAFRFDGCYWIYTNDGVDLVDEKPYEFVPRLNTLRIVERGMTALEGVSLLIHSPQVQKILGAKPPGDPLWGYSLALPASQLPGTPEVALLVLVGILPQLISHKYYHNHSNLGIGTCGVLGGEPIDLDAGWRKW